MPLFSILDLVALAWFVGAWAIYSAILSLTEKRRQGLNSEMNRYRDVWMFQMLGREMRMVDAQIVAALQNGTAFFASTSLIAIGGALTLLRSSDAILKVVAALPSAMGGEDDRARHHLRLRVLQVRLGLPALQLRCDPGRRHATRQGQGHARGQGSCRAGRTAVRSRRPALQPRPARVLFRARLSRLVYQP